MAITKHRYSIVGIFLVIMSLAMFALGITYGLTQLIGLGWLAFGFFYVIGIFGILSNKSLKKNLDLPEKTTLIAPPISLIVLVLGIILSIAIGGQFGERYIILGTILSVGIHLFPLRSKYAYIIALFIIINSIIGILLKDTSVLIFIFIDALIKLVSGIYLLFYNKPINS